MKFEIFKDELRTDDFMVLSRKVDTYWTTKGFSIKEEGLPRHITLNDAEVTIDETGRIDLHYGATTKRSGVLENRFGIYRISPSSSNNYFKLAIDYEGKVVSQRKLPTGRSYLFIPKVKKLYANSIKGRGLALDTSTGEVVGNEYPSNSWKVYDVISFEAN